MNSGGFMRSLVITSKSFIYGYLKSSSIKELAILHPKNVVKSCLDNKYNLIIIDFSLDYMLSKENIKILKERCNKLIGLIPSDDSLLFRKFPFYYFDFTLNYPFSLSDMLTRVENNMCQYSRTSEVVKLYEQRDYNGVIGMMDSSPTNEEELICFYNALSEMKLLSKAEEVKSDFYTKNKLPHHPRLKLITKIGSGDISDIVKYIENDAEYFCENIENQLLAQYLKIKIKNERTCLINDVLVLLKSTYYEIEKQYKAQVISDFSKSDIKLDLDGLLNFSVQRDFKEFLAMSNVTKMCSLLLSLNHFDVNALKSIKRKNLTFTPLVNGIVEILIKNKIEKSKSLERHEFDYDFIPCHVNFLKSYKSICFKTSKSKIKNSVYLLGKRNSALYADGVKKLSSYFKDYEIMVAFNTTQLLKVENSFQEKA
ncbi:hypothetical protein V4U67_003180 [Vibrio vulnificus]